MCTFHSDSDSFKQRLKKKKITLCFTLFAQMLIAFTDRCAWEILGDASDLCWDGCV